MTTTIHGVCPVCGHEDDLVEYQFQGKVYPQCKDSFACWDRYIALKDKKEREER